ncbi:MAG: COX15/CtaA family protein [Bauldia litoralis]
MTSPFAPHRQTHPSVIRWLVVVAVMIFIMVVIGGLTRLTESGLSMVEWKPLSGWLPPMNSADWQTLFEKYQATPQFKKQFPDLTVDGFKGIFWLEFIHRVWGRLIGVVFFLGFIYLLVRRRLSFAMTPHLAVLFVLGAVQGALGWYMVASGLVDRPSVSHYRLAAHLGLAILIYVYVLWFLFGLVTPRGDDREGRGLRNGARIVFVLIGLTVIWGAFVAGLDAGKIHNTFPRTGGQWFPADYFDRPGFFSNIFANPVAVQFNHRVLAVSTVVGVFLLWCATVVRADQPGVRGAATMLLFAVLVQAGIGIATLLMAVPVWLGVLHQAMAMVVVTAAVWFAHTFRHTGPAQMETILSIRQFG